MTRDTYSRRSVLRAGAGLAVAGAAATGAGAAQQAPTFDGWLDGVENYHGLEDRTNRPETTVEVGTQANGGSFGFGPAAIQVDPGTTVTWEWVAGTHNVVDDAGGFESEMTNEAGHTFSHTFEEEGVVKYFCAPHKSMGMRGVVVVGDVATGNGVDAGGAGPLTPELRATGLTGALVAGLLSPIAYRALRGRDGGDRGRRGGPRGRPNR